MLVLTGLTLLTILGVTGFNLEPQLPVIKRGAPDTYFGFSVAQHLTSSNEPWILVGAPLGRNLQPGTNQSGALFKCPLTLNERECSQVVTDGKRDPKYKRYDPNIGSNALFAPSADEFKEGQWLGVNVRSQGRGGKVMVCAHRYIHQGKDFRWGLGLCHFLDQGLNYAQTLEPCRNKERHGLEDFGFCQVGTAGDLLEDDTALMGAPGAYTCRGTMYGISVSDDYLSRDRTQYHSPFGENSPVEKYTYLGMSVAGGKFFGDRYSYATGAPKAAEGSGQILFFSKNTTSEVLQQEGSLTGDVFASSYGYELAALDLNGDNRTDIVVGAPFYMDNKIGGDCGAAYVYINDGTGFGPHTKAVKLVGRSGSRFGFALASLGDINHDRFEDLAVGAPYDDQGAVYIYLGSADGLILEPSQVIRASKYFPDLRTFGYSLSGGMDLDRNSYPDLLIGAYDSSAVVLLRSRPIIDIVTEVRGNLTGIDPTTDGCEDDPDAEEVCFTVETCFEIREAAKVRAASLGVNYSLEAETFGDGRKWSRVYFKDGMANMSHIVLKIINVQNQAEKRCQREIVYLKKPTTDIQTPVSFKLSYALVQRVPAYVPNMPLPMIQNYPILNQQEASKTFMAQFEKDCGENELCESDLFVKAATDLTVDESGRYTLVLGKNKEFLLNVSFGNFGESAYEAYLYVEHPKSMSFKVHVQNGTNYECKPYNSTLVRCYLGNPYKNRGWEEIGLRFDASALKDIETRLDFNIWANSTSLESDEQNDYAQLTATVVKLAELSIRGKGRPTTVEYSGELKGESAMKSLADIGSKIIHTYEVFNHGPWKASYFHVEILWPHQVGNNNSWPHQVGSNSGPEGKWLLYLERKPEIIGDGECFIPDNVLDVLKLAGTSPPSATPPVRAPLRQPSVDSQKQNDPNEVVKVRRKRWAETVVAPDIEETDGKKSKVVKMDCIRGSAICFKINCIIKNLLPSESVSIHIHSRLWNATLVEDYPTVDIVRIFSVAQIRISQSADNRQDPENDIAMASTDCLPNLKLKVGVEGVAWWIYVVSGILGLLLLLLIVFCLYRFGFFIRRRPQPTHTASLVKS